MSSDTVSPLRISKPTTMSTPSRVKNSPFQRALGEIPPTSQRRNSPSYNQATRKMILSREGSPFESAATKDASRSPFWKERNPMSPGRFDSENAYDVDNTLSPKRSSIENLKKASRVKNSSMFAREQQNEYDPARSPVVERPLAKGRPLSTGTQVTPQAEPARGHKRGESLSKIPFGPTKSPGRLPTEYTTSEYTTSSPPARNQPSPTKSSLANSRAAASKPYDPESSTWSEEDNSFKESPARPLRRHAKSVTFDAAPPQINEYEMVTPDPSAASGSREGSYDSEEYDMDEHFGHDAPVDQDDSFDASLEDTEKTPVVLPEDWRHMSPDAANTSLIDNYDDVFNHRDRTGRLNESTSSDSENRPLPPLPGGSASVGSRGNRNSLNGLSSAAERFSASTRSLPSPPKAASVSKDEIRNMRDSSMSLDERLRLMGIHESPKGKPSEKWQGLGIQNHENEIVDDMEDDKDNYSPPRISRESILKKVRSRTFENVKIDYDDYTERGYGPLADLDPDVPIPSREASSNFDEQPTDFDMKHEKQNLYDGSGYSPERSPSRLEDYGRESSVVRYDADGNPMSDDDDTSVYSHEEPEKKFSTSMNEDGPPTPKATEFSASLMSQDNSSPKDRYKHGSEFDSFLSDKQFDLQLRGFMSGRPTNDNKPSITESAPKLEAVREFMQRPSSSDSDEPPMTPTQEDLEDEEPGTPDSVIRHPIAIEPPRRASPAVPEAKATIKAPGGKLKTRPSITPADVTQMAAARRQVSGQMPPPIPERSPRRSSVGEDLLSQSEIDRSNSLKKMQLKISLDDSGEDLSMDIDKEFDRLVEAQKNGYFMRENKKIVVASNRQFSDEKAPPSPTREAAPVGVTRKPSDRGPTWTTEPWNGKMRRKSVRQASGGHRKAPTGPAPPLPGQESNVNGLGTVAEDNMGEEGPDDGAERGRLFVKVVGVKDLDLPLPTEERTWFQLTLDNGLHCVTTSWLELGHSAPIGQEFELVVLNDLEFQLTLQTKLEPPAKPVQTGKSVGHKKSSSAFGKFWTSPKKRAEKERKEKEEAERAAAQELILNSQKPKTAWDLMHNLVAPDGSFARAYVCLKNHESQAFGRPFTVDIPCFNEWALEDTVTASSVKSKHGGIARRPPYKIGKLTLQLLYVPKPNGAKDEDMPKSMNACIREMKEAEEIRSNVFEGHLSQQGGDCPYWRRRFFRLVGTKLTAYHTTTMQPRATINLLKAIKLIDDRSSLTQSTSTKSGGRRKSAFSEEEEGYMFVEEGFRLRFANGEVIDFYADNAADKESWMKVLSKCVGTGSTGNGGSAATKKWCDLVLDKERRERRTLSGGKAPAAGPVHTQPGMQAMKPPTAAAPQLQQPPTGRRSHVAGAKSMPSSPVKNVHREMPPAPIEKSPRHQGHVGATATRAPPAASPQKRPMSPQPVKKRGMAVGGGERRQQIKSMLF